MRETRGKFALYLATRVVGGCFGDGEEKKKKEKVRERERKKRRERRSEQVDREGRFPDFSRGEKKPEKRLWLLRTVTENTISLTYSVVRKY